MSADELDQQQRVSSTPACLHATAAVTGRGARPWGPRGSAIRSDDAWRWCKRSCQAHRRLNTARGRLSRDQMVRELCLGVPDRQPMLAGRAMSSWRRAVSRSTKHQMWGRQVRISGLGSRGSLAMAQRQFGHCRSGVPGQPDRPSRTSSIITECID